MLCSECARNQDRPHICTEAQLLGECARCCVNANNCFSLREVADLAKQQWGLNSPEEYLQALFNSRDMVIG